MTLRRWVPCLLLMAATPGHAQEPFDYDRHLGLAFVLPDGAICLTIHAPGLQPGTPVLLVDDRDSAAVVAATLRTPRSAPCPREVPGTADVLYTGVTHDPDRLPPGSVVVAVVASRQPLLAGAQGVAGDLDGDGVLEYFRQCASNEGVHFTVWSGTPLRGERRWHRYFYLGYDVEPSCTEAEYRSPGPAN
ncbi:MAG TPA: hypothetical protein VFH97_09790 [Gemmatimonadales bacterium]|nr:hypothetical protein [Gemmatimonadales bacterium]